MPYDKKEKATALLDNLLTCSMAEAARRVGVSPSLPWKWLMRSRMGDPDFQEIEFCDVVAPFHTHYERNVPALAALQIQQTAIERARDGVYTDVFFQGVRQYEKVLKPEYAGMNEADLWIEVGEDWQTRCYEMRPTKQWLKPSDALVVKMLESWGRKRYGSHQEVSVTLGGVLRLERPEEAPKAIEHQPEVFEEENAEERGRLALARPAKDSKEMDKWAEAGEFKAAAVTFVKATGERTELRADLERHLQEVKELGPQHTKPEGRVMVGKPDDEPKTEPQPEPFDVRNHPRAYEVEKLTQYQPPKRQFTSKAEASIGTGREGIGEGADPEKWGKHQGFRVTK